MIKKISKFLVALLFTVSMATSAQAGPTMVQICGATSGGTYFLLSNAIAQMLNTRMADTFLASAQSTAGTPVILRLLETGEAEFGFGQAGIAKNALDGVGGFEQQFTNISSATYVFPNVMQVIVSKEANIKTFADFRGQSFAVGASGSATEMNSRDMAQIYGLGYLDPARRDFTPQFTSESQSVELLQNRMVVGGNFIAASGAASVTELLSSGRFELLEFSDESVAALMAINPAYFPYVIPANTYANQPEPVRTFAVANFIFCSLDLPEELVYNFIKALYNYREDVVLVHQAASYIQEENAVSGLTVPLHPGAERFLREIGAIR
jgi:hypothetical protein